MKIALHQPNYIPWMGFFHKISQVELFIFFDNIAFPQGKSWLSRNRINLQGREHWLTVPVVKSGRTGQTTRQVEIINEQDWAKKHLKTLHQAYAKAPYYNSVIQELEEVYAHAYKYLADFNIAMVERISRLMGLSCSFARASERVGLESKQTDMIVEVCRAFGGTWYLSGTGCLDFIEPHKFELAGIKFVLQQFKHPVYPQPGDTFLPSLSILDALFRVGPTQVQEWLVEQPADCLMTSVA